jgi:hypothetical protein
MDEKEREQLAEDADNAFPPRRRPLNPIILIGSIVLIVLVIGGGIFAAGKFIGSNGSSNATPTLVPGSNLFYVQVTPSWGTIFIDGQKLARLPDPTTDSPLQLSPGVHQVVWQASPFASQRCTIVVPPQISETRCLANDPVPVNKGPDKGLTALAITFTASSLSNVPEAQRIALIHAAQAALDALQASDTVQPGEHFANLNANQFTDTATSTLRATLHFLLDTNINSSGPCAGVFLGFGSNCHFNGQDCHTFCTIKEPPHTAPPDRWDVFGIMKPTWSYTTRNGQVVAQNQPDETDNSGTEYEVGLYITWDGSQWHVKTSVPGNTTSFRTSAPSCAAAYIAVNQAAYVDYSTVSLPCNPNQPISWNDQPGANPAAGCLLTAYPLSDSATPTPVANPKPIAHFLYRFGVLLALDNTTHRFWPNLPVATTYEQTIAQQIAAQKPVSI